MAGEDTETTTKAGRLLESYGLGESFGQQLESYWTGDQCERRSLRDLADLFNRRLLEAAIVQAGGSPTSVEVDKFYETLTGEASSSGQRTEVEQRLDRIGVDVDEVVGDFVSYQAIRSYLTEVRGADYAAAEPDAGRSREAATSAVRKLRSRLEAVTASSLETLDNDGSFTIGEPRTTAEIVVVCEACGSRFRFDTLVERGGCACESGDGD